MFNYPPIINRSIHALKPTTQISFHLIIQCTGKTLQTISLILDHRPLHQYFVPAANHPPNPSLNHKLLVETEENLWEDAYKDWKHEMDMCNISPYIIQSLSVSKKPPANKRDKKRKKTVDPNDDIDEETVISRAGAIEREHWWFVLIPDVNCGLNLSAMEDGH